MGNAIAIFQRELKAFFLSPIAYIVITIFIMPQNYLFLLIVDALSNASGYGIESPMAIVLGQNVFVWLLLFATMPAITMKLFSEEKRSGTIEVLMTAPVTDLQVIIGKYMASLALYIVMWLPTLAYVVVVWWFGDPDILKIAAGYLGVLLTGAMFLGFGLLASSLTNNQIIAYFVGMFLCFGVLLLSVFLENTPGLAAMPGMKGVFEYTDILKHMSRGFSQGIVDTRNVVYYVSLLCFSLFLTLQVMESRQWKR